MDLKFLFIFCFIQLKASYYVVTSTEVSVRQTTSINVDEYCIRTFGAGSYMCRTSYNTGYGFLCGSLYCFDAVHQHLCVFSIPPQDSTLCGNGKWCNGGTCVADPHAQKTSDLCPLGDSMKPNVLLGMNCSEVIRTRPSLCRDPEMQKWCCDGCSKTVVQTPTTFLGPPKSIDDECKAIFGKMSYFCQSDAAYPGNDFTATCKQMKCYKPGTSCVDFPGPDGIPCGNGKWCVNGQCVASAGASLDPQSDCLYGDKFAQFCQTNIVYPNVAVYCAQYETSCCGSCLPLKNTSAAAGCEYGDKKPDVCKQHINDHTITAFCLTNEQDCCATCEQFKRNTDPSCPFGDASVTTCQALMNDSIGPGNCYSQSHKRECCDTCKTYYNTSNTGCEYGDHWKDYCTTNVVPPNVASQCSKYESQCCGTCSKYKTGLRGCEYGDTDPDACVIALGTANGTSVCYNLVQHTQCCGSCEKARDTSNPRCEYGDKNPTKCDAYFKDPKGKGNCYDFLPQNECCQSCADSRDDTSPGCEYGDHQPTWCSTNVHNNDTAFLCFTSDAQCCDTCKQYKLSDIPDCKYGDKNPQQCAFMIPDAQAAASMCPSVGNNCCGTCSKYGQAGPAGIIPMSVIAG